MRATGPGADGSTSPPVAVSWTRRRDPCPGRRRDGGAGQGPRLPRSAQPTVAAGQNGGHGMAGQSPARLRVRARSRSSRPTRAARCARISRAVSSAASRSASGPSAVEVVRSRSQDVDGLVGQRLAAPSPTAGCAACPRRVKRDAVVDAVARRPSAARQQVAALAVGVVDHDVEHRAIRGAGRGCVAARAELEPEVDRPRRTSIHSWHMPAPNGPSRSTVGGTRSQPVASETSYAATSRAARVPSGKSHSGRSPATGL